MESQHAFQRHIVVYMKVRPADRRNMRICCSILAYMPMQVIFPEPDMKNLVFSDGKVRHVTVVRPVYSRFAREKVLTPSVYKQKREEKQHRRST
jgi:hypothetical protein